MSTPTTNVKITLEDISKRKEEIRKEIEVQQSAIIGSIRNIFVPEPSGSASSASSMMRSFNTGMAIFDGVMTGIKIMRKVKAFFKRMK